MTATRRDFLKLVAVAGAAGGLTFAGGRLKNQPARVSETRLLMGTLVNLTAVGGSKSEARQAINRCFDRMADQEKVFSRFIPDSALSALNRDGFLADPPAELVGVLQSAQRISLATNGAYDITVKPLFDLYQSYSLEGKLPPSEEIEAVRRLVGHTHLQVSEAEISFTMPGMAVTLDSIAKGYIVDRGVSIFKDLGYLNVLVEAGGDLMASGLDLKSDPWQIGVAPPRSGGSKLLGKFGVVDQAVASSGDYLQYFSADWKNHHIIDPRSGYSSPYLSAATVTAPSCMAADSYATALMVLTPREGINLIESLPGYEAMLITKSMESLRTSGFG